jgi:hypothetical protein
MHAHTFVHSVRRQHTHDTPPYTPQLIAEQHIANHDGQGRMQRNLSETYCIPDLRERVAAYTVPPTCIRIHSHFTMKDGMHTTEFVIQHNLRGV